MILFIFVLYSGQSHTQNGVQKPQLPFGSGQLPFGSGHHPSAYQRHAYSYGKHPLQLPHRLSADFIQQILLIPVQILLFSFSDPSFIRISQPVIKHLIIPGVRFFAGLFLTPGTNVVNLISTYQGTDMERIYFSMGRQLDVWEYSA